MLATGQAGATALECGAERLSYGELRAEVGPAPPAHGARAASNKGDRVLVFAPDGIAWVIAYLGAIWAGGVAVGLNSRLFERELSVVLSESGARFIWCNESSRALLERLLANIADPAQLVIDAEWTAHLAAAARSRGRPGRRRDGPCGVHLRHHRPAQSRHARTAQRNRQRRFRARHHRTQREDRIYASSKMFFAYARSATAWCAGLRLGATVILDREWPTADGVAELVERHRPTALFSVPTLYLKNAAVWAWRRACAAGVRHYVSAGEGLPAAVRREWREATGVAPVSGYGASETVVLVFYCDDDSARLKPSPRLEFRMRAAPRTRRRSAFGCATPRSRWGTGNAPRPNATASRTAGFSPATCSGSATTERWNFAGGTTTCSRSQGSG